MDDGLSDLGGNDLGNELSGDLDDLSELILGKLNKLRQLIDCLMLDCLMLDRAIRVIQQVSNWNVLNADAFHSRFTTLDHFTHRPTVV